VRGLPSSATILGGILSSYAFLLLYCFFPGFAWSNPLFDAVLPLRRIPKPVKSGHSRRN
jgi:hypothetical protein